MDGGGRVRILHVVPSLGVGGVEVAAQSAVGEDYQIIALSPPAPDSRWAHLAHTPGLGARFRSIRSALKTIARVQPDVVVFSLWKTVPVLLALRAARRRVPIVVLMLHSDHSAHFADSLFHWIGLTFADHVWADSMASLNGRYRRGKASKPTRVVSFTVPPANPSLSDRPIGPGFVYWGRLHAVKRVDRAIRLFRSVRAALPSATFTIIGPDDGEAQRLEDLARELGCGDSVVFLGPRDQNEIWELALTATFFVQMSEMEGRAMAVIEAMQLGLVPIVTPVGDICDYCRDGHNAVLANDIEGLPGRVIQLLDEPSTVAAMGVAARAHFDRTISYREDVRLAATEALRYGQDSSNREMRDP